MQKYAMQVGDTHRSCAHRHAPLPPTPVLQELAVSSGSACTSASLEPSYVLRALGVEEDMAHTSIRYACGHGGPGCACSRGMCSPSSRSHVSTAAQGSTVIST